MFTYQIKSVNNLSQNCRGLSLNCWEKLEPVRHRLRCFEKRVLSAGFRHNRIKMYFLETSKYCKSFLTDTSLVERR